MQAVWYLSLLHRRDRYIRQGRERVRPQVIQQLALGILAAKHIHLVGAIHDGDVAYWQ